MNGFTKGALVFSLVAVQALAAQANSMYGVPITPSTYTAGGLTGGSGTYTYTGNLEAYAPPLASGSSYYHHVLDSVDETLTITNKYMTGYDNGGASAAARLAISGVPGHNQTVDISGCKFEDINHRAIYIKNVDNLIVNGDFFDTVKTPINVWNVKRVTMIANKSKNHSMYPNHTYNQYVGSHVVTFNDCVFEYFYVEGFLVDNTDAIYAGLDLSDGSADRNNSALRSDYFNFRTCSMASGVKGIVKNSIMAGSENVGEAQSGCGFILDHDCDGVELGGNVVWNATATGFGSANSSGRLLDNIAIYTAKASSNLTYPYRTDPLDPYYGKIMYVVTRGIGMGYYTGHSCDAASGVAGEWDIYRNRLIAYRSSDLLNYYAGALNSRDITRIQDGSTWYDLQDNSFSLNDASIISRQRGTTGCIYTEHITYLNSTGGTSSLPTPDEVCQLLFDMNYTEGMATNGALFAKWGTANNHELYFDENRVLG